jgi:hypothetical protein
LIWNQLPVQRVQIHAPLENCCNVFISSRGSASISICTRSSYSNSKRLLCMLYWQKLVALTREELRKLHFAWKSTLRLRIGTNDCMTSSSPLRPIEIGQWNLWSRLRASSRYQNVSPLGVALQLWRPCLCEVDPTSTSVYQDRIGTWRQQPSSSTERSQSVFIGSGCNENQMWMEWHAK